MNIENKIMWWGYLHSNGSLQVKRWWGDHKDYTEDCEGNDFVQQVVRPFEAKTHEEALKVIRKATGPQIDMDTIHEKIWETMIQYPQLRVGQCMYNALAGVAPEIARKIKGTKYDPFDSSKNATAFFNKVEELVGG